jgi:hypothetical protein
MNRKQFVILLVLVVVLGGAGLLLMKKQKASWSTATPKAGNKILGDLPVNDITHVAIRQGSNEVNLVKRDDLWRVRERSDYPANFSQIKEFLLKAAELKAVQTMQAGPSQWPRLQLVATGQGTNAALIVEFKGAGDKTINTLLLGKKHLQKSDQASPFGGGDEGWPDGRYVKVGADSQDVAVISDPLENIEPNPGQWLDRDFFRIEKARSIDVQFPVATNSWKLARQTEAGDWKLDGAKTNEVVDPAKIGTVANPFNAPSFSDVFPGDRVNGAGTNAPVVVTIDTFDNFHYTVKTGSKTNEDYLVTVAVSAEIPKERTPGKDEKPEDKEKLDKEFKDRQQKLEDKLKLEQGFAKWTYLVSGWSIDSVLKERWQLIAEENDEPEHSGTNVLNSAAEPRLENPPLPVITPK